MRTLRAVVLFALTLPCSLAAADALQTMRLWEQSVVTLEVTRKEYDYFQPWSRRSQSAVKVGVVTGPRQILTTGRDLQDLTLIRVQKSGRGRWWDAEVEWVDYLANVALVTVQEDTFWTGLEAVRLADSIPARPTATIMRWSGGTLDMRKGEFSRFGVSNPGFTDAAHAFLELSVELDGAGLGEPAAIDTEVIGLVFSQQGSVSQILPAPFIRSVLDAREEGGYRGLGYFDFTWQPTENPETHRLLGLPGEPRGVVVIEVPQRQGNPGVLRPRDLILEVEGFDIDIQGDYLDPDYGHLLLENLATRNQRAGDTVRLTIWRDGAEQTVDYVLPRAEDAARLIPEAPYDEEPEYLVAGGLVFQPLTRNYLRSWGQDWERRAPFRLAYFRNEEPSLERPSLVILSLVLPDLYNLGYQEARNLVLEQLNGKRVSNLAELAQALEEPQGGFHQFDFMRGDSLQRIVLSAEELPEATRQIQKVYGIEHDRRIADHEEGK
jgi:S1-C subfamily serine protease